MGTVIQFCGDNIWNAPVCAEMKASLIIFHYGRVFICDLRHQIILKARGINKQAHCDQTWRTNDKHRLVPCWYVGRPNWTNKLYTLQHAEKLYCSYITMPQGPKDTMPHVPLAYWGQESEVKPLNCHQQNNAVWRDNANYKSSNYKPSKHQLQRCTEKSWRWMGARIIRIFVCLVKAARGKKWEKNTVNVSIF